MVKYTKYGKHRYQAFIFDDDNVTEYISENISHNNFYNKYKKILKNNEKIHKKEKVRMYLELLGYHITNSDPHLNAQQTFLENVKMIIIDMTQIENIHEDILLKVNVIALNREIIINELLK